MRLGLTNCVCALLLIPNLSFAANDIPTMQNPERFITGTFNGRTATSSIEKAEALIGSDYSVISGAIDAIGTVNSYLRLFNGGTVLASFSVTLVKPT